MKQQSLSDKQMRQGDVLLVRVGNPSDVAAAEQPLVLKEGEATGHKHQFMAESRVSFRGREQLAVGAAAALAHEEHSTATIPAGLYDLPRQVEWTDEDEPRVVSD